MKPNLSGRTIALYQVDAFTNQPFRGNPAAVCWLEHPIDDALMQAIAAEMNLSETAFLCQEPDGPENIGIRYFSPLMEVPLCGHATLASAHVFFEYYNRTKLTSARFCTQSGVSLEATPTINGIQLVFPLSQCLPYDPSANLLAALGLNECLAGRYSPSLKMILLQLKDEQQVRSLCPDFSSLRLADKSIHGVIVTAKSSAPYDFVSRYFCPAIGVNEDPVTGAAHTLLAPYWADVLQKEELYAYQASERGGIIAIKMKPSGQVALTGQCVLVVKGNLILP